MSLYQPVDVISFAKLVNIKVLPTIIQIKLKQKKDCCCLSQVIGYISVHELKWKSCHFPIWMICLHDTNHLESRYLGT